MVVHPEVPSNKPVQVFPETEILKSSNTWEFLLFEQIRQVRFLESSVFEDPELAERRILQLATCINHLESLLFDKICPSRNRTNDLKWKQYLQEKPTEFHNLENDISAIKQLLRKDMTEQFRLVCKLEKWFLAMDKYMAGIKKIQATSFEMTLPQEDILDSI